MKKINKETNNNNNNICIYSETEVVEFLAVGPPAHGSKIYFIQQGNGVRNAVYLDADKLPLCVNDDLVIMSLSRYQEALNAESEWQRRYKSLKRKLSGK